MTIHFQTSRVTLALALAGASGLMSACTTAQPTAFQLMQEQQQLQAQARQQEDAEMRKSAPTQPDMLLALVRESQTQGRHFAALAYVDAYVQKMGMTPEVAPLRAHALRMTGQAEASEQAYRALLSTQRAAEGWHGLGLLAGARGDFAAASDSLSRASVLAPTDADILSDLGYARLRAGDLSGARLPLGQAAELNPASIKVIANLALLLLVEGQTERASQVMTQGGMSDVARAQLQQLAAETRAGRSAAQQVAVSPADSAATANESRGNASRITAVVASRTDTPDIPSAAAGTNASPSTNANAAHSEPAVRFFDASGRPEASSMTQVAANADNTLLSPSAPYVAGVTLPQRPYVAGSASAAATPTTMLSPFMDQLGNTPLVR